MWKRQKVRANAGNFAKFSPHLPPRFSVDKKQKKNCPKSQ
jgi:hypothetical protein